MQKIKYIINNIDSTFRVARKFILPYAGIRYIIGNYFYKYLFENEADGFRMLKNKKKLLIADVGGNDGLFSRFVNSFVSQSHINIFEPIPFHYKKLKSIKSKDNQFVVHSLALGFSNQQNFIHIPYVKFLSKKIYLSAYSTISEKETTDFSQLNHFAGSFYFHKKIKIQSQPVSIKKLDSFKLSPDILKIDVEGFEERVVLGALQTINNSKSVIYVEQPSDSIDNILKEMGYTKYIFHSESQKFKKVEHNIEKIYNYYFIHDTSLFNENAFE